MRLPDMLAATRRGARWALWPALLLAVACGGGCRRIEEPPASGPATRPGATRSATSRAVASPPPRLVPTVRWDPAEAYLCRRAKGPITIDRADHRRQWQDAVVIDRFLEPRTLRPATSRTEARLLWDDRCLYIKVFAHDTDLRAKYTRRTDPLWEDDVVDMFFKPTAAKPSYYQFQITPINTVGAYEVPRSDPRPSRQRMSDWPHGIRSAVYAYGTVNDPAKQDGYYRAVMAIPWKNLRLLGGKAPKTGDTWRFSICRYDYWDYPTSPEEYTSAPLKTNDFHRTQDYTVLKFVD